MILASVSSEGFPKCLRLLKRRDFLFRPYQRYQTENFNFIFSRRGQGRLGISISKKVLRRAIARNRVRRLVRESFRLRSQKLGKFDVHVVGLGTLTSAWSRLKRADVETQFDIFIRHIICSRES